MTELGLSKYYSDARFIGKAFAKKERITEKKRVRSQQSTQGGIGRMVSDNWNEVLEERS